MYHHVFNTKLRHLRLNAPPRRTPGIAAMALATFALLAPRVQAQSISWDYQPYRVRAIIALDVPGGVAERLIGQLSSYLDRRVAAAIGPVWSFDVEIATGALRHRVRSEIGALSDKPPTDIPLENLDKLVLVAVEWSADGYSLTAREYDTFVQRWGTQIRRETRQPESLPEQVFAILAQAVAPLAQFELVADDEKHVLLKPRGAALLRHAGAEAWTKPGDVFLPILRRTTRGGELVENGIQPVPWTFVEVVDSKQPQTRAQIHSGTRRPFGIRRQGRVEQVAIALRSDPADTRLRLHSRIDPEKPLDGYEIYAQNDPIETDALERLGATDRSGELNVPPTKDGVRFVIVKNGGQVLARLPIVPGAQAAVDVPLPDDDARLAAETWLSALREDLIDVVARRSILMARVRQRIKTKDFDTAEELLLKINQLPGRAQFNLELTTAARRMRSEDPQIQRRIDQLFEGTQAALTQYLDTRPVNELSNELRAAQQQDGG